MFWGRAAIATALSSLYALSKDDDDEEYKNMDLRTRDGNWIVGGMKLAVPGELGAIFKVIPERVVEYMRRQGTPEEQEAFEAVLHLGGGRTELWDIADGLSIIDVETEALEEHLSHVIEDFVDSLTAVVYKMVMDNINGDGKFKYRRPE
jgi:hypothetical protein